MTVYVDLVFVLNLFFDFLILITVNNTLKRNSKLLRMILGSFLGSFTMILLFISMNTIVLFLFKVLIGVLMCFTSFGIKDKKYSIENISYFYMTSIVLGGFLYFLSLSLSETHDGFTFFYEQDGISYVFLLISTPMMLFIYHKQRIELMKYQMMIPVTIQFKNKQVLKLMGFVDTGNRLKDPITNKWIILVNKKSLKNIKQEHYLFVSYHSLNHHGLIKCLSTNYIEMNQKKYTKYLVGISEDDLLGNGIECVVNMEGMKEK